MSYHHMSYPGRISTSLDRSGKVLTANEFLSALRSRGASRLQCVRYRRNRSTVWSLTQRGTTLNVHIAYRGATEELLDAFAVIVREGGIGSRASRLASDRISAWPALEEAINDEREAYLQQRVERGSDDATHCAATPEQRTYLTAVYRYFNQTRFDGLLPDDLPIRLSRRMKSALGHMLPLDDGDGQRRVLEIALNIDLMLPGNGAERIDTLLHEMAHAADFLTSGERGHGASWRAWARRVGCQPTTLYDRPVRFRKRRRDRVGRVPPLPPAVAELAQAPTRTPVPALLLSS